MRVPSKVFPSQRLWDDYYKVWMIGCQCPCCEKCWLYLDGPRTGHCSWGGPHSGYMEIPDGLNYPMLKLLGQYKIMLDSLKILVS